MATQLGPEHTDNLLQFRERTQVFQSEINSLLWLHGHQATKNIEKSDSRLEHDLPSGWQKWGHRVSYFGLSSAFRAYLFVGGILAVLVFILYNESLIQEFEEEKKEQVGLYAALYAFAVSKLATTEQTGLIFREVIVNPRIDFPIIFTNYKGEITDWKGEGLPEVGDTSKVSMQVLRDLLEKMDSQLSSIA